MKSPIQHTRLVPSSTTGFGFEEIMRNPDYSRFTNWYARSSLYAKSRQASSDAAVQARFDLPAR